MLKLLIRIAVILFGVLLVGGGIAYGLLNKTQPSGRAGSEADELARRMMVAVNHEAWLETGAISWDFGGRQQHLWDKHRHLSRVRWKDIEVLVDLNTKQGLAFQAGSKVADDQAEVLLKQAWAFWANDSFWLNPIAKSFDQGVTRSLVGDDQLLVEFGTGGVTPGDAYLWDVGEDGLPRAWHMWVSIVPIGGLKASWEDWQVLSTGVKIARRHQILFLTLALSDIQAAGQLADLTGGVDPFAPLVTHLALKTTEH